LNKKYIKIINHTPNNHNTTFILRR